MSETRPAAAPIAREQTLILVDEGGRPLGHAPRSACHRGDGLRHAAIAVVVLNERGEALLQRRRSALWDGWWDVAGATHPLRLPDRDESEEEAVRRCLRAEWHVEHVPAARLARAGAFTYFARYGEHAENEWCALFVARHGGPVVCDAAYAYGMRWAPPEEALAEARVEGARFTPWGRIALEGLVGGALPG